jgi:polysaccharide export outer membrane protein
MLQKRKSFLLPALTLLIGLVLRAQTTPPAASPETNIPQAAAAPATPTIESKPVPGTPEFVIGPLDVLFVHVLHEPDMTGRVEVGPDGMISIVLAGQFRAEGLTAGQLSDAIRDRLRTTIRAPEVSVQVMQVNSRKFTLQGEVRKPGTYPFSAPITVLEALAEGQGFSDWANTKKIYLLRKGERMKFNYKDVSHGKHPEQNVIVQNGDEIFVP